MIEARPQQSGYRCRLSCRRGRAADILRSQPESGNSDGRAREHAVGSEGRSAAVFAGALIAESPLGLSPEPSCCSARPGPRGKTVPG